MGETDFPDLHLEDPEEICVNSDRFEMLDLRVAQIARHVPVDGLYGFENKGDRVAINSLT